jgi:hypothetical protein
VINVASPTLKENTIQGHGCSSDGHHPKSLYHMHHKYGQTELRAINSSSHRNSIQNTDMYTLQRKKDLDLHHQIKSK